MQVLKNSKLSPISALLVYIWLFQIPTTMLLHGGKFEANVVYLHELS
jgi:hypothetical protein